MIPLPGGAAERFGLRPQRLAGDTAYGSAEMLNWLVEEKQIAPHVPVIDKSGRRDGTFAREEFRYDGTTNTYTCPGSKTLTTTGVLVNEGATLLYRASKADCGRCALKPRCCPNTPVRKVPRSLYERARDFTRSLAGTPAFEQSRRERKRGEMLFAHLKCILRLGRLRHRNPALAHQLYRLKLELPTEAPPPHDHPPVPENTLTPCPPNRQQPNSH